MRFAKDKTRFIRDLRRKTHRRSCTWQYGLAGVGSTGLGAPMGGEKRKKKKESRRINEFRNSDDRIRTIGSAGWRDEGGLVLLARFHL